ncbi:MAG: hypothetical protein OEM23_05825 [Gemmatimonadota bacterium]|nr:hypothetical protein [Gemmatimonadota bacterium]MDH3427937.1 hypothetical protein [Gemmatimonadota bacterium]
MAHVNALETLERDIERIGVRPSSSDASLVVPTGLQILDDLLPNGGLPRGRIVEWSGPASCGKTAVLRASLERLRENGESVALIDGSGALYAPDWARLVPGEGEFWVVRPDSASEATWCADMLLRSGAFGAVALRIAEPATTPLGRGTSVRLQRLAEEAAAVFVTVGQVAVAALRLGFRPGHIEPLRNTGFGPFLPSVRPVWVSVGKRGTTEVPVLCPVPPRRCLPVTRDRKGPL